MPRRSWASGQALPNAVALVDELNSVVDDVLERFPKLEQTLKSSLVAAEQKEQLLGRVFGSKASKEVLNFLKVLSRHGRLGLLRPSRGSRRSCTPSSAA